MITIDVLVQMPYQVLVGSGVINQLGNQITKLLPTTKKVAVITDETVQGLYFDIVKNQLAAVEKEVIQYVLKPGETAKSAENYIAILSWLAQNEITRTDTIIAFGGGVIGDLAGFVAATYLRGISYIGIPTTLLAMVDSSVGGKTAIDLPAGKNLVGAFYQPRLVLVDIDVLATIPPKILNDGYAEIIKYGMIGDAELLKILADNHDRQKIIARCIKMKSKIVCADPFDATVRNLLNFGHTIGHALELLSDYQLSHGQAVAIGMAVDTRATGNQALIELLERLLVKYELSTTTDFTATEIFAATTRDKKRSGNEITNVVPVALGICELQKIPLAKYHDWLKTGLE